MNPLRKDEDGGGLCRIFASRFIGRAVAFLPLAVMISAAWADEPADKPANAISDLSLEELLDVKVTTVSRRASTVGQSPAAIFVVTPEMIRRSGATSVMEALRMVPGLDVARGNGNTWAISARGFNSGLANKLLVQVDGRSVYTPVYSGVYWDTVDYPLEDIDRIEVIRGPGASVWGANAVNGIINIITKRAQDTQGGLLTAGTGNQERGFGTLRYGGRMGEKDSDWNYRVFAKGLKRDPEFSPAGDSQDGWKSEHTGFRVDRQLSAGENMTLQGDLFESNAETLNAKPFLTAPFSRLNFDVERSNGGNLLFRWGKDYSEDRGWELQSYVDRFDRKSNNQYLHFRSDTYDLDYQYRQPLSERQKLVYGFGYRMVDFRFDDSVPDGGLFATFPAGKETTHLFSGFVQDEISLRKDKLSLTLGTKVEHNSFTGFEVQPSGRLLWTPDKRHSAWASVSRAVRTPSFIERGLDLTLATGPVPPAVLILGLVGSENFNSEEVLAYEMGYRAQPTDRLSVDTSVFFNDYRRLSTVQFGTPQPGAFPGTILFPIFTTNRMKGQTYGFEASATYQAGEKWKLYGAYTFLRMHLNPDATLDPFFRPMADAAEGRSPKHQVYLRSSWDVGKNWEADLIGRYVSKLPRFTPEVPSYFALDARVAWKSRENLEFAVVGQNLLDDHHAEFGGGAVPVEIKRAVYGQVTYRW